GIAGGIVVEVDAIVVGILGGAAGTASRGHLGSLGGGLACGRLTCATRGTSRGLARGRFGRCFLDGRLLGRRRFFCLCAIPYLYCCLGGAFACRNSLGFLDSVFRCEGGFTSNLGHSRFRKRNCTRSAGAYECCRGRTYSSQRPHIPRQWFRCILGSP